MTITEKEYTRKLQLGYGSKWQDYNGTHPELKGKRTVIAASSNGAVELWIEGHGLTIKKDI